MAKLGELGTSKKAKEKAAAIKKLADQNGVATNFLFTTTLERYLVQIDILDALKKEIEEQGFFEEKTYVKGTSNAYASPAAKQYNSFIASTERTASTLMKVIKELGNAGGKGGVDPLLEIMGGLSE